MGQLGQALIPKELSVTDIRRATSSKVGALAWLSAKYVRCLIFVIETFEHAAIFEPCLRMCTENGGCPFKELQLQAPLTQHVLLHAALEARYIH